MYVKISELPITILNDDVIVDVETVGNFKTDIEATTTGWIRDNELIVSVRESYEEEFDFEEMRDTTWEGCDLWAWNCGFEAKVTKLKYNELKRNWPMFQPMYQIINIDSSLSGDTKPSKEMPQLWEQFIETGDTKYRDLVVAHNTSCLLKELTCYLYLNVVGDVVDEV